MAQTFTDDTGKDWILKVNPVTLDKIERELEVSFSAPPEDQDGPVVKIATDCMFAFRALWVLVEKQARERGITSEDFGDLLVGDTLGRAQAALCQAIADFHPDPARRAAIRRVFEIIQSAEAKIVAKANAQLESFDIDAAVQEVTSDGS